MTGFAIQDSACGNVDRAGRVLAQSRFREGALLKVLHDENLASRMAWSSGLNRRHDSASFGIVWGCKIH